MENDDEKEHEKKDQNISKKERKKRRLIRKWMMENVQTDETKVEYVTRKEESRRKRVM